MSGYGSRIQANGSVSQPAFLESGAMFKSIPAHDAAQTAVEPTYFTRDGGVYLLRVWSEREWVSMPAGNRPQAEYVLGLGWVGGEFVGMMN